MSQATLSQGPYRNSNLFSGYYLDEQVYELDAWDCDAEAREAFEALNDLYETRKDALSSYDEAPLRNHWIDKVLEELGYETLEETPLVDARGSIDRTLYDTEDDQMTAAVMKADGEHTGMYGQSLSILEAKQWDADFTERFAPALLLGCFSHRLNDSDPETGRNLDRFAYRVRRVDGDVLPVEFRHSDFVAQRGREIC